MISALAQKVRNAFGPDFSKVADVIAEMLEVHVSRGSAPVPPLSELAWKALLVDSADPKRAQLIEIMAMCFWAARLLPGKSATP